MVLPNLTLSQPETKHLKGLWVTIWLERSAKNEIKNMQFKTKRICSLKPKHKETSMSKKNLDGIEKKTTQISELC
jgi:hypothetical protein